MYSCFVELFSINRRDVFGLMEPFERGKYNKMGEVAFGLGVGQLAGPIENLDKTLVCQKLS